MKNKLNLVLLALQWALAALIFMLHLVKVDAWLVVCLYWAAVTCETAAELKHLIIKKDKPLKLGRRYVRGRLPKD